MKLALYGTGHSRSGDDATLDRPILDQLDVDALAEQSRSFRHFRDQVLAS